MLYGPQRSPLIPPFQEGRSRSSLFRHVLDGLVLLHGLLPMATIEFLSDHTPHGAFIQTVWGNSKASRVGAGSIETLNTTSLTEGMLGFVRIECISGYALGSLQELESRSWNNEVFILLLLANAAVAVKDV